MFLRAQQQDSQLQLEKNKKVSETMGDTQLVSQGYIYSRHHDKVSDLQSRVFVSSILADRLWTSRRVCQSFKT